MGEDRHLQRRGAAEVVHQQNLRRVVHPRRELFGHPRDGVAGTGEVHLIDSGLAVDAEAKLGLAGRDPVLLRRARDGAGIERHADTPEAGDHPAREGSDGVEVLPGLGGGTGDLVDEERAREAPGLWQIGQRDVVIDDHHGDPPAKGAGAFGGEAEVQPVAGVVLDDEQAPGLAGDGEDPCKHRIDGRRGEDVAADCDGQQAASDETRMARLVAGSAARDQRHAIALPVGADDDPNVWVAVEAREPAAGGADEPVDRLGDDALAAVDELRHGRSSLSLRPGQSVKSAKITV
jgi:hypothetical protein